MFLNVELVHLFFLTNTDIGFCQDPIQFFAIKVLVHKGILLPKMTPTMDASSIEHIVHVLSRT